MNFRRKSPNNSRLSEAGNAKPWHGCAVDTRTLAVTRVVRQVPEYTPETRSAEG